MNKILFTIGCAMIIWLFLLILLVDPKKEGATVGIFAITLIVVAFTLIIGGLWW